MTNTVTGDEFFEALSALASPQRLRILAMVSKEKVHVSELARRVAISRPLAHMHLQRLERAGLVKGHLELSADGKALKYFEVVDFAFKVTPAEVAAWVETLNPQLGRTTDDE